MGILRDFENRLEGAVEGFFARAFRSGLQPVELAKAVQRYAGNYQQVGVSGVIVPNVYRFELSPEDLERFEGFSGSLERELADVVRRTAGERGWRLEGAPRIELVADDAVRVGTYELRGKVEADPEPKPRPTPAAASGASGSTRVLPTPSSSTGTARLRAADGTCYTLTPNATVGRLPSCDIVLDDPSVSRRHARVARGDGRWTVEDLGSTNGLHVNGKAVGRAQLQDGDRVEFGGVALTFTLEA
ncbi:MAG TPA: DUF3662 and FHA domain-containing protein [Egibacteraceae bacterium]|nr:DUF3662 and FHA domain-containing protein [Egibacteraceae bacterium]